jgi:beta-glucosidase
MSGEAASRSALGLPGAQEKLLERLHATGKPMVVVLMNGRPLALPWLDEHVPAIVEAWYLGVEMGHAVADVLFGAVNPSGKLPCSFPRAVGQVPLYYNHKRTGRPPSSDEPYTSKYLDVPWTPLYPFGHGLSYTTFRIGAPRLSASKIGPGERLGVQVTVENTGARHGTEVVQLYLRDDVASTTRPVKELRGFTRVALAPGAAQELSFTLEAEDLALLDGTFRRVLEPGTFTVFVGASSTAVQEAKFELTRGARLPGSGSAIPRFMRSAPAGR